MKFKELRKVIETALINEIEIVNDGSEYTLEFNRTPEQKLVYAITMKDPILDELDDEDVEFLYISGSGYSVQFVFTEDLYKKFKEFSKNEDVTEKISNSFKNIFTNE